MTNQISIYGISIRQDAQGRFCLNDLHKANGGEKRHQPSNWLDLQQTIELIEELSKSGIPGLEQNQPVNAIHGGTNRGTYVCKELVYSYAMWVSAKFSLVVIRTFDAVVTQPAAQSKAYQAPLYARRMSANIDRIPITHFSMLNEAYSLLYRPLEDVGYNVPDEMYIDISTGKMFCDWLKKKGINTDALPSYSHRFTDDRKERDVKLYPMDFLVDFRRFFIEEWIPERAVAYFKSKDINSLSYLEKVRLPLLGINKQSLPIVIKQPALF